MKYFVRFLQTLTFTVNCLLIDHVARPRLRFVVFAIGIWRVDQLRSSNSSSNNYNSHNNITVKTPSQPHTSLSHPQRPPQRWPWIGSIHGLVWVGLGWDGLGWVGLGPKFFIWTWVGLGWVEPTGVPNFCFKIVPV
jgi:hypothetical protein